MIMPPMGRSGSGMTRFAVNVAGQLVLSKKEEKEGKEKKKKRRKERKEKGRPISGIVLEMETRDDGRDWVVIVAKERES